MISKTLKGSKFMKFGIPFIVLVVGGSFGLKQFTSIKYEFYHQKKFLKEKVKEEGIPMKSSGVTLESEFEKIQQIDTTNWENKRGPRPWEENNELFLQALERAKLNEEKK